MTRIVLGLLVCTVMLCGCKTAKVEKMTEAKITEAKMTSSALPTVTIYKTRRDYRHNVPVTLDATKTRIVSYPHPSDLKTGDLWRYPTMLNGGYLLDNKGINVNTAFLKYTYEEYARLRQIPTPDELYRSIIDKDPIVEMWNCGRKGESGDMVVQLNDAIDNKSLAEKFKRIK